MIRAASFAIAAALLTSPALVAAQDVDGVIATGSAAPVPMTTDQKIANILAAARADDAKARGAVEPRRVHGEVGAAVGSDGYRSAYVAAVVPVGEAGAVALAYGQSRGGRGLGYSPGRDACAAPYDGRQPVEPPWAAEMRGRSVCEAPARD